MNKCNTTCPTKDLGLLLMRLIIAAVFIFHGSQKLLGWNGGKGMHGDNGFIAGMHKMQMPMATAAAWAAALAEFGGGILVGLGLLTRLAAIPMAFTMAVAVFRVHWPNGFAAPAGFEYPLTLGVVLLGLILTGPGWISLDALLLSKCCRRGAETPPGGP